jgi:endonuclease G, mitochondrial
MTFRLIVILILISNISIFSQEIEELEEQIDSFNKNINEAQNKIDNIKLAKIKNNLLSIGMPKPTEEEQIIEHDAMILAFNNRHKQASWVLHIISKDIIQGKQGRTNDFRPDSLVSGGSAVEADYFISKKIKDKYGKLQDSIVESFGYDRGHLAPSADFKWSKKALSESYFYSNMSPQSPAFNRGKWEELESNLREYVTDHQVDLFVVTGPILDNSLKPIAKSINKVSIPKLFFKIALDTVNKQSIGYIMPNSEIFAPVDFFACSIDSIEKLTGYDFFNLLDDKLETPLESKFNAKEWLPKPQQKDATPLDPRKLGKGQVNTVQARLWIGKNKEIEVCGTLLKANYSKKKAVYFLTLDKHFPNGIITVMIPKSAMTNFDNLDFYKDWIGKKIGIKSKVERDNKNPEDPTIFVKYPSQIRMLED